VTHTILAASKQRLNDRLIGILLSLGAEAADAFERPLASAKMRHGRRLFPNHAQA
jgi:hypothetical protein